jgi:hypothetical protein
MAVGRRQVVKILKKHLLLDQETVNVYKNLVIVDINHSLEIVNVDNGTQSKVKESKVNKTKEKEKEKKEDVPSHKQVYDESSIHYQLALHLFQNILANDPDYKEPNLQKWANDVRLMMERDNRTEEQIRYLMNWCQNHSFWKSNILSPSKLREKFGQLVIQVKEEMSKQNKSTVNGVPRAYQSLQDWADEDESQGNY